MLGLESEPLEWLEAEAAFVEREILTAEEFYALEEEIRNLAWTITRLGTHRTMVRAKDKLEEIVTSGGTLDEFVEWAESESLVWSEAYTELIYRNAVFSSYSMGRYEQIMDPDIEEEFQYLMYDALEDGRVRPAHEALDEMTWRRDQFPQEYWTPNGHNCRCEIRTLNEYLKDRVGGKPQTGRPAWESGDHKGEPIRPDTDFRYNTSVRSEYLRQRLETKLRDTQNDLGS